MRRFPAIGIPLLVLVLALISAADYQGPEGVDTDYDGMTDAYELFFGLNSTNPADAYLDFDGDLLSNLQESAQLTDPFAPDTDRDEFNDDVDASPISRAYIQWGAPQFTTGDQYDYAHPDWFLSSYKVGGEWVFDQATAQSGWYVASTEPPGIGSLSIDLDRTILTNNLRYAVHYMMDSNASLYVDMLDTNGEVVVEDLYGDLMGGTNAEAVVLLDVPTASFTNAAVIRLWCGDLSGGALAKTEGEVVVYGGLVYIDEDGDGLDADQERQLGTSDYCIDSNGDGTNDYDECFNIGGSSTNNPLPPSPTPQPTPSPDEPKIIYVDQATGNDAFTGRAPVVLAENKGPKKTICKGMSAVDEEGAHTLVIKSGTYHENLDLRGKDVKVVIEGNVRL